MQNFTFHNPTQIYFGKESYNHLIKTLKKDNISSLLWVYGRSSLKSSPLYNIIKEQLNNAGIRVIEHDNVSPNPLLFHTYEGIKCVKENNLQAILAIGGGSVMDESKAIALGATSECDVWDYFTRINIPSHALPIYCIPTLAATGSEMNGNSVITHDTTRQKLNINALCLYPKVSFLAPELTMSLSHEQLAYACVDAMVHILEGYFTKEISNPLMERQCEAIVKTLMKTTKRLLKNPQDYDARSQFMWSTTLALNSSLQCGLGNFSFPNHILEIPLSGICDIPHGAGLSVILPAWIKWYSPHNKKAFQRFFKKIFHTSKIRLGIGRLELWLETIGAPIRLSQLNISPDLFDTFAVHANELARLRSGLDDFYTVDVCKEIYGYTI